MSELFSRIPNGFRYYAGSELRAQRQVEKTAREVFAGWSYEEIVPPIVDYYALFEIGMGEREAARAFSFTDTDGSVLALRPDVTSSIARAAETLFRSGERPLRFCYCSPVFHQQSQSSADWRRESKQIGCELLGANSIAADLEVLLVAIELLHRLSKDRNFVITLNDVQIFNGIVDNLGFDTTTTKELHRLVDIRALGDLECFLRSYVTADESSTFAELIQLSGKGEIVEKARRVITNARSCAALDRLERLWRIVDSIGLAGRFEIDLGDVSNLDYYTGPIFKIYMEGSGQRVGAGGRYDNLTAKFGQAEPAIGFVLAVDPFAELIAKEIGPRGSSVQECVTLDSSDNNDLSAIFRKAIELRAAKKQITIRREVSPCPS